MKNLNRLLFALCIIACSSLYSQEVEDTSDPKVEYDFKPGLTPEQLEKGNITVKKRHIHNYEMTSKYLYEIYISPAKKEMPKLKKLAEKIKQALTKVTSKKTKEKYKKQLNEVQKKIELNETWLTYTKAYAIKTKAFINGDFETAKKGNTVIALAQTKIQKLTGEPFPNILSLAMTHSLQTKKAKP